MAVVPVRLRALVIVATMLACCNDTPTQPSADVPGGDSPFNHPCPAFTSARAERSVSNHAELAVSPRNASSATGRNGVAASSVDSTGSWTGKYRVTGCQRACGLGPDICKEYLAGGGEVLPLDLVLRQTGAAVSGTLDFLDNTGSVVVESGEVVGAIDDANVLTLSGTTVSTEPAEPSQSSVTDWSSTLTTNASSMSGRFTLDRKFENQSGSQQIKVNCELVNVGKQSQH